MSSLGGFAIISLCQLLSEVHFHSCYLLDNLFIFLVLVLFFSNGGRLQKGSTVCEGGCNIASSRCLLMSQYILGSAQTISAFIHWLQDELISCQILSKTFLFMN